MSRTILNEKCKMQRTEETEWCQPQRCRKKITRKRHHWPSNFYNRNWSNIYRNIYLSGEHLVPLCSSTEDRACPTEFSSSFYYAFCHLLHIVWALLLWFASTFSVSEILMSANLFIPLLTVVSHSKPWRRCMEYCGDNRPEGRNTKGEPEE